MLTDELPTLCYDNHDETSEENETGLRHVLLPSLSTYIQRANWYSFQFP
jgi:hypothetical protein